VVLKSLPGTLGAQGGRKSASAIAFEAIASQEGIHVARKRHFRWLTAMPRGGFSRSDSSAGLLVNEALINGGSPIGTSI
jgi:hypothetical protein